MMAWCLMMSRATDIRFFGWYGAMTAIGAVWGVAEIVYRAYIYRNQPVIADDSPAPDHYVVKAAKRAIKLTFGFAGFNNSFKIFNVVVIKFTNFAKTQP